MTRERIPEAILTAAHERSQARANRDWAEADRLRAEIEAAGWKVVDHGTDFALTPAVPPDVEQAGIVRYGSSRNVPSRLDDPASGLATVVLIATDHPDDLTRTLDALGRHAPTGTSIVLVADDPSTEQAAALERSGTAFKDGAGTPGAPGTAIPIETIWTSARLGYAAAINIGIRRSTAPVIVLLDTSVEPTGDLVTPLATCLEDPSVAVVGGWGIVSDDLRQFREAPAGDVDAIEGYCQAFRRSDADARGPLDEHFRFYRNLDIWWSLVLRDEGEGEPPRRALRLDGLPADRHEHRGWSGLPETVRTQSSKRNFYRVLDRFGHRLDLLTLGRR